MDVDEISTDQGGDTTAVADDSVELASTETTDDNVSESATEVEAASTDGDEEEPEDWRKLASKTKATDPKEIKAFVGKEYAEKSRYAAEQRKLADERAEEITRVKAQLAELEAKAKAAPAEVKPEEPPADLKALNDVISALEKSRDDLPQTIAKINTDGNAIQRQIIELETRLKMAEDFEKPNWEAKIEAANARLESKKLEYERALEKRERIEERLKSSHSEKKAVEKSLAETKARQAKTDEEVRKFNESFPKTVDGFIAKAAAAQGLPVDDKTANEALWQDANEAVMVSILRLQNKGINLATVDMEALVAARTEQAIKNAQAIVAGLAKGKKAVATKAQTTTQAKPGAPAAKPVVKPSDSKSGTDDELTPAMRAIRKQLEGRPVRL